MILFGIGLAYSIRIMPKDRFCFDQETIQSSELSITYFCVQGKSMNIKSSLMFNGSAIDSKDNLPSGNYYIQNTQQGVYQTCLINQEDDVKQITFFIQYTEKQPELEKQDELSKQLIELQQRINDIHQFQRQSQQVERRLQNIMIKIQKRVKFWTFLKFCIIISFALYQIRILQQFFLRKNTGV